MMLPVGWTAREMTAKSGAALLVNWPGMRLDRSPEGLARAALDKQTRARDDQLRQLRDAFHTARAYQSGREAEAGTGP